MKKEIEVTKAIPDSNSGIIERSKSVQNGSVRYGALKSVKCVLMTVKDLASHLNLSPDTIYKWVRKRKIPFYKIHRELRFDPDEIDAFLAKKKVDNA